MILAIVPARGGSKRFPRKNTMPFGGRPLLAWSIALAKSIPQIHCVVSTEDAEIARVARQEGAAVIARPAELAGDESSMVDVMVHAATVARAGGLAFEGVMLLQPTNPLRPREMVERAMARFRDEACDSLIAVSRRALKFGTVEDGVFKRNFPVLAQSRTVAPVFYENGLLYLTKAATLIDQHSIYGERTLAFETERPFDEVDIDEPIDLAIGEALLGVVRGKLGYQPAS